jgi:hypothetical protein
VPWLELFERVLVYVLTIALGWAIALGISEVVGLVVPAARYPAFTILAFGGPGSGGDTHPKIIQHDVPADLAERMKSGRLDVRMSGGDPSAIISL